jgi:hypothetical protein
MRRLISLLTLVLLAVCLGLWFFRHPNAQRNAWHVRELATQGLAQYLAQSFPGSRVLVISNPFTQQQGMRADIVAMELAGVRGLQRGLGSAVALDPVAFPELKPAAWTDPRSLVTDPETSTPLSFLVADEAFDTLVRQHPQCSLVVSLIGLPAKLDRVKCWQAPSPKFALLLPDLRCIGDAAAVASAVKRGKLAAFVLPKPDAPGAESPPQGDFNVEFEKRFLLVNAKNIDQVMAAYPQLFP